MRTGLRVIAVWTLLNGLLLLGLGLSHVDFERPSGEPFRPGLAALFALLAVPVVLGAIQLWRLKNAGRVVSLIYYVVVVAVLLVATARGATPGQPVVPIVAGIVAIVVLLLPQARAHCTSAPSSRSRLV